MAASTDFHVGERVCDLNGNKGSVRYIGTVATSKDPDRIWIGVEWDAEGRGKHDGSVIDTEGEQVRYFACKEGKGSFVPFSKLVRGTTLVSELLQRYRFEDDEMAVQRPLQDDGGIDHSIGDTNMDAEIAGQVSSTGGRFKPIQLIGAQKTRKQKHSSKVDTVMLNGRNISSIGKDGCLKDCAPAIERLDLSENLLHGWSEVFQLGSELTHLQRLVLNGNYFPRLEAPCLSPCFKNLEELSLCNCSLRWSDIEKLSSAAPRLRELHLSQNVTLLGEGYIEEPHKLFTQLEVLDLSNCGIERWEQVSALSKLQTLKELRLNGNAIEEVLYVEKASSGCAISGKKQEEFQPQTHSPELDNQRAFAALECLWLNDNRIKNWRSINELNKFPSLVALRMKRNPIFQALSSGESRLACIARIGNLKVFDGSSVQETERRDAEILYLNSIALKKQSSDGKSLEREDLEMSHPRYKELVDKHGDPQDRRGQQGEARRGDFLKVKLVSMAAESSGMGSVQKTVPASMTVGTLKLLMQKTFGLSRDRQKLYVRSDPHSFPLELDCDSAQLRIFGVYDGYEVMMQDIDE